MSDLSRAWVWTSYQGVVHNNTEGPTPITNRDPADDPVVQFSTFQNSRREAMAQKATQTRTKFGLAVAGSILVGAFFPIIAFALFLIAALLIISGREPQKTENFLANLPGGDYAIKALAQVDRWLS